MHRTLTVVFALLVLSLAAARAQPPAAPTTPPAEPPVAGPVEPAAPGQVAGTATAPGSFRVHRAAAPIRVDGVLDEPAWQAAEPVPLAYEWLPGDNVEPPVRTEAFVTFDADFVYVAFVAHDPDPSQIRAHLMDRDEINTFVQDDHVSFMIDPFNDERRAFQFRINPLGVQADAVFSQVEFVEDFSWDVIWESAGRITDTGYVVEVAVPVSQLRFPATSGPQTWGIELSRSWPRSVRHRISANPRDRANNCLLCQVGKATGFEGLEPGLNLEIVPTFTAIRTDALDTFPDGELASGDEELEPGITARWGVTPALTLNAAVNPDFSQVEADAAQLANNERFALFFPEKRPFFLEGIDFFATPLDAVFTRTVVDPEWGLKLTGKQGRHAGGVFVTEDEVTSLLFPGNQGSATTLLRDPVTAAVVRYRRDVGTSSTIGILYTGREGDAYRNHVAGVDGFLRLSPTDEVRFQALRSETEYPLEIAQAFGQPEGAFSDEAWRVNWNHQGRHWYGGLTYDDLGDGFRADSGFLPRVDVRTADGQGGYVWWGEADDLWTRADLNLRARRTEDQAGRLTDERLDLTGTIQGPRQSVLQVSLENNTERVGDTLYEDMHRGEAYFEMQPGAIGKVSMYVDAGDAVDYQNNRPADILVWNPTAELKLGQHVNAQLSHLRQELDVDAGRLSTADLSQIRLVYNLSVRSFLRAVVQRLELERDPSLYAAPVDPETETWFTQLLFSYKLNPQTVLFLGYSDNRLGLADVDLTQTDRTFFVKVGYAWLR